MSWLTVQTWVARLGVAAAFVGVLAVGTPTVETSSARLCVWVEAGSVPVIGGAGATVCIPLP